MKSALLILVLTARVFAAPLGGPLPGYLLDPRTGSLRPILGIPGAMQLGSAVPLPFQVVSADFSAAGDFAVAISSDKPSHLYLIQNLSNPSVTDLGAVADNSSVLAISGNGRTAVLSAPGQLQFLTGLPSAPVLASALPSQALLGPISAGLVDDAGQCALLGTSSDSGGAFETFCADGTAQRVFSQDALRISAIVLTNQGQDALLADTTGQQVLQIANYSRSTVATSIASAKDGLTTPVALQVNGQQLIVADSAAASLFMFDLTGQSPVQSIALTSTPARLKFLSDRTVMLLNDPTLTPFTIFDLQTMQSFFIPTN